MSELRDLCGASRRPAVRIEKPPRLAWSDKALSFGLGSALVRIPGISRVL